MKGISSENEQFMNRFYVTRPYVDLLVSDLFQCDRYGNDKCK